ncbi:MAG: family 1 encapsulin nanocompartment shell protein [Candidatus Brocadiia bacterium]
MSHHHLAREDAPFGDDVWEHIDKAAIETARGQLSARRMLHVEGPYGLGLKALGGPDELVHEEDEMAAAVSAACLVPLASIRKGFTIPMRDIAAHERGGVPFGAPQVAHTAIACARREDQILFNGSDALGVAGLLNMDGSASVELGEWAEPGAAMEDLIKAATALDDASFHGPYALGLSPERYNLLFRRYRQGNMVEIEHVRNLVTDGVVKVPALDSGGVMVASGRQFATIVLGQDLSVGFIGPADGNYEFDLSETVALRVAHPGCICVLR